MHYLFLFLSVITLGCSAQTTKDKTNRIDTVKLFNPNNHPTAAGAGEIKMFKQTIFLTQPNIYVKLNEKEYKYRTLTELGHFIKKNKREIKKELLCLLTDSNTSFKKITSIIDTLKENQITDYMVLNIQQYFTPPPPVGIETPASVISTFNESDSTSFTITIFDNGIDVELFKKITRLKTTKEFDSFITLHKQEIKKITIVTTSEVSDDKFTQVVEVLKKHEFYKFNLVSK